MTTRNSAASHSPSILLILPYFGTLPSYAELFFRSCAENPTVNWLFITDQQLDERRLPRNVALKQMTFAAMKQSIDAVMGMQTALRTPYKLCDFKPAYGVIFAEEAKQFTFWGHCDMDLLFGDIRKFVTDDLLQRYDKLFIHAHLSLYRNCEEANNYYRLKAPGIWYRDVYASPKVRSFSEFKGINLLLRHHKIPFFRDDNYLADIDQHVHHFQSISPPNYKHQCFCWDKGRALKMFWDTDGCRSREYLYIHLQKRRMQRPSGALWERDAWYIAPHEFIAKHSDPSSPQEMDQLNQRNFLFDSKQLLYSSLWRVKWGISQTIDPWPRRA